MSFSMQITQPRCVYSIQSVSVFRILICFFSSMCLWFLGWTIYTKGLGCGGRGGVQARAVEVRRLFTSTGKYG